MRLALVSVALLVSAVAGLRALASPLLTDEPPYIESDNRQFVAVPESSRHATAVLKRTTQGATVRQWTMWGWEDNTWLSDDGEYLVVGYHGANLV